MHSFSRTNRRGFTLIEVMISLAVFLIIMLAMSQTFTQAFAGYKNVKSVQRDTENAQFALNLMAKELRTSSIVSPSSGGVLTSAVKFYDYSQGLCLEYRISASALQVAKAAVATFNDCVATSLGSYVTVTTGTVTGGFIITPSVISPQSVGKVTASLQINEGPNHTAYIQTTSSLRDYGYIGLTASAPPIAGPGEMVFTADGTFTVPVGVTIVTVNMVGGGGGGGNGYGSGIGDSYSAPGAAGSIGWGAGGGGGGTAANYNAYTGASGGTASLVTQNDSVTGGQTIAVTVGDGGIGGTPCNSFGGRFDGAAGGQSSFSSIVAPGGAGGIGGGGLLRAPAPSAPAGYAYGSPPTSGGAGACAPGGKGAPGIVVVSW